MITVRAPGKLFIAGEYAVVEPGQPAVIIAIDRYLAVTLTESVDVGTVHSPEYGQLPLVWRRSGDDVTIDRDHHPYDYVMSAITTVERVRARRGVAPKFFDTRIDKPRVPGSAARPRDDSCGRAPSARCMAPTPCAGRMTRKRSTIRSPTA